jgi:U2-associated protein SR140
VRVPDDLKQRFLIDSMALYVLKDGCEFEQLMMMEQQGRPEFNFLFDLDSPEHIYYRWRLYSLAGGWCWSAWWRSCVSPASAEAASRMGSTIVLDSGFL